MKIAFFAPIIRRDCGPMKDTRCPKYILDSVNGKRTIWNMLDYGSNDYCVCVVENPPIEILGPISVASDAILFPEDLEAPIGVSLYAQIAGLLEPIGIPVNKFSGATKAHALPAFLLQHFKFACRKQGLFGANSMGVPLDLSAKIGSLSKADQDSMTGTAAALKLDVSAFGKNLALREVLNTFPSLLPMDDLHLCGLPFSGEADAKLKAKVK